MIRHTILLPFLVAILILTGCGGKPVRVEKDVIPNGKLPQVAEQCKAQPDLAWCKK